MRSTPIRRRTLAGIATKSSRLEPRNSSGFIVGAADFFGFTGALYRYLNVYASM
jgi:hypothetical protein